jgi:hypothetical protein
MLFEALTYAVPILRLAGRMRKHQKKRKHYEYQIQMAPMLTGRCMAIRGGWSPTWATIATASTAEEAHLKMAKIRSAPRWKTEGCIRLRARKR